MTRTKITFAELFERCLNAESRRFTDLDRFINSYKSHDLLSDSKLVFAKYAGLDVFSMLMLYGDVDEVLNLYDDDDTVYVILDANMKIAYINDDVCEL